MPDEAQAEHEDAADNGFREGIYVTDVGLT